METPKLIELCLMHRDLIKIRKKRLREIRDPKRRIMKTVTMVNLKLELLFLEQELCDRITLPLDYAVQDH